MPQNKLAEIRRSQNKTLLDFYNKSGMRVSRLSDIERGKALPVSGEMKVLNDLYGISTDEILDIVDPAVGQIGTREEPESERDLVDGILCCVGCHEENPGDFWFWTPVRQSEHAGRPCERCQYGSCHNPGCIISEVDFCGCDDDWCEEEDYEEEWQDPLEHVCQGCGSDLCICGKCHVPACEEECFECMLSDLQLEDAIGDGRALYSSIPYCIF